MMIFDSLQQTGKSIQIGTAARRALDGLLGTIYKQETQEWFSQQLRDLQHCRILHLGCGNGQESFMLANFVDYQSNLMGVDEDIALVEISRHDELLENMKGVQFLQANPVDWISNQSFDLIYTRVGAGSWTGYRKLMENLRRNLKDEGILLLQVAALSEFHAYPYNHAFARAMELISLLEGSRNSSQTKTEYIQALLQQSGFNLVEKHTEHPAFILHTDNQIVSLALEACREQILHSQESTTEELNALLLELREFEQQEDTLISRPGLQLLVARPEVNNLQDQTNFN